MVIKNLMAAEQTKREEKFLILFSILNFNRSTSARLILTAALLTCRRALAFAGGLLGSIGDNALLCASSSFLLPEKKFDCCMKFFF